MTDQLLARLLALRTQLTAIAARPEVRAARQLTAEVMPVLEPVWTVLVDHDHGVGFLRRLGTDEDSAVNAAVAAEVVRVFASLDLVGPGTGAVWQALSRPSIALVTSIRRPPRRPWPAGDQPVRATLGASVRPVLPGSLLREWRRDTDVVPALRQVLRMWCDLARSSAGERREVARLTLAAAMLARGAVLAGDTATVRWFVKRWLGLAATDSRVDGVSAALVENGWHPHAVDDEFSVVRDAVTDLRVEALYQHRVHRPVWETQLRGVPVALLGDVAPASQTPEQDAPETMVTRALLAEDVRSVLATVNKQEAGVARLLIMEGRTLAEVASIYGVTSYRIKQVRDEVLRKLRWDGRSRVLKDYA